MRDPYMYPQPVRHRPGLEALAVPFSHALTKNQNDSVVASWPARNTSQTTRFFYLELSVGGQVATSPLVATVGPGATVQNSVSLDLAQPGGTVYTAALLMHEVDAGGSPLGLVSRHDFTVTVNSPSGQFLQVVIQGIAVVAPDTIEWQGAVTNNSPTLMGFYRPTRTETTNQGGPFIRQQSQHTVLPGATDFFSQITSYGTGAGFIVGEMWVEEWAADTFVRDLNAHQVYDVEF